MGRALAAGAILMNRRTTSKLNRIYHLTSVGLLNRSHPEIFGTGSFYGCAACLRNRVLTFAIWRSIDKGAFCTFLHSLFSVCYHILAGFQLNPCEGCLGLK